MSPDTAKDGFGNIDIVKNIPNVIGTGFDDKIFGGNHANTLSGEAGDDLITGGGGNDKINGGEGGDDLFGGSGADAFQFKTLTDSTVAIAGRDTIFDFSRVLGTKSISPRSTQMGPRWENRLSASLAPTSSPEPEGKFAL
jgi:Ca2+-binding RTX toxin-like protein